MFHLNLIFLGSFVLCLRLLIPLQNFFNYYSDFIHTKFSKPVHVEFDFIVVGSGSAGSVVANVLSKHSKVLLVEVGGDPLMGQSIPSFVSEFLYRTQTDWMYQTTKQKNSHFGHEPANISKWPRGLGLGGTSNLHYTIYCRSHPLDYDNWANVTNDSQWRYENLLTYFKKSLNYNGKFKTNEEHYGNGKKEGNNLNVESKPSELETLLPFALEAATEIGVEAVDDLNGPQRTGIGSVEYTQKDGARCSAYSAFIKPILDRKNLIISRYSLATKIQLDKSGRAIGVWILRHGELTFVRAKREIIVSAGVLETPKLLMLSEIGPKKVLENVDIIPQIILPVGENLIDHFSIYLPPIVLHKTPTGKPLSTFIEQDFSPRAFYNYFIHGQGPLTQSSANNFAGFITTPDLVKTGQDWPNIQIVAVNLGVTSFVASNLPSAMGWNKDETQRLWENVVGKSVLLLGSVLARPKSKGTIQLKDNNPLSRPLIDPNYLNDPQDLDSLVSGINFVVKLMEGTEAFQKVGARMDRTKIPSCQHLKTLSRDYWECYIRQLGQSGFHPSGTCPMGRGIEDPKAVVDSNLRVLHTKGLRIADASVMPEIVNGNLNAAIFMIGEKVADLIRHHWADQFIVSPQKMFYESSQDSQKCFYSRLV